MIVRRRQTPAFTLVELLIATAILAAILVLLTSFIGTVNNAWSAGERQASEFQDGRAILDLISRDLTQAVISPTLQFVVDPNLSDGSNTAPQRGNSDSLFWQAPIANDASGRLAEVGYYLSEDLHLPGADAYQLKRFYVPPSNTNYLIFTSTPAATPSDTAAPWVSNALAANPSLCTTVASGVIAFWARAIDRNGDPVPWPPTNAGGRYNSAAHFQAAVTNSVPTPNPSPGFKYTDPNTTLRANQLPAAVEIALVTLDGKTFARNPQIPPLEIEASADDLPSVRDAFNQALIANNVKTARTFTTRIRLPNAEQ